MKQTFGSARKPAEAVIKDIRRGTRRHFSSEDKIRIVLEDLRGEDSIAELCRREGIASSMYYVLRSEGRRCAGQQVSVREHAPRCVCRQRRSRRLLPIRKNSRP
jgi:transposase